MVLTNLDVPDITGVRFTEQIRELYDSTALPVIMVTWQNEVDDFEDVKKGRNQ